MSNCECMAKENLPVSVIRFIQSVLYFFSIQCSFYLFVISPLHFVLNQDTKTRFASMDQDCQKTGMFEKHSVYLVQFSAKIPGVLIHQNNCILFLFFAESFNHKVLQSIASTCLSDCCSFCTFCPFVHSFEMFILAFQTAFFVH